MLRYLEGVDIAEIAASEGVTRNAIDQALHRGHEKLRGLADVEPVDALFDEFAAAFARGERPEVLGYLGRAGEGAGELAALIDAYLVVAVPPPPSEAARRRVRALIPEQTLRDLRTKAGLKRDRLVDEILAAFSINPVKRKRVKNYYRELEAGLLDPAGVSPRLWALLGRLLSADPSVLIGAARHADHPVRIPELRGGHGGRSARARTGRRAGRCRSPVPFRSLSVGESRHAGSSEGPRAAGGQLRGVGWPAARQARSGMRASTSSVNRQTAFTSLICSTVSAVGVEEGRCAREYDTALSA